MSGSSPRSIAVVVVHGVADQQPHDSARAIAGLLSSRNMGERRYTTFTEDDIRIDVEVPLQSRPKTAAKPAAVAEDALGRESLRAPAPPPPRGDEGTFYWRTRELARQKAKKAGSGLETRKVPGAPSTPSAPGVDCEREPGMVLMLSQLEGYRPSGSDSVYRTVRLSSEKIEGEGKAGTPGTRLRDVLGRSLAARTRCVSDSWRAVSAAAARAEPRPSRRRCRRD